MRHLIGLALALFVTLPAFAEITFIGEAKVPAHSLAKVKPVSPDFKSFIVRVVGPDGKRVKTEKAFDGSIIFTGPPGIYRVEAIAGKTDKDGNLTLDEAEFTVTIEGKPEPGPKPPGPDPKPEPLPDGKLGLIKASRDGAALVSSSLKTIESKALAAAQRVHANKVAAGVYADAAKILDAWRVANRAALDGNEATVKEWAPWAASVRLKVEALHKGGSLPGDKEWAACYEEIAEGLESAGAAKKKER